MARWHSILVSRKLRRRSGVLEDLVLPPLLLQLLLHSVALEPLRQLSELLLLLHPPTATYRCNCHLAQTV